MIGIPLRLAVDGAVPVGLGGSYDIILCVSHITSCIPCSLSISLLRGSSSLEVSSAVTACSGPRLVSPDTPPLFRYWHPSSLRRACCHHHSISAQDRRRNLLVLRWDCKGLDTCKHGDRLKRFSPHVHPDGLIAFTRTRN